MNAKHLSKNKSKTILKNKVGVNFGERAKIDVSVTYFMTSEKLTASSMPGNDPTMSWSNALPAVKKSKYFLKTKKCLANDMTKIF